jgi:hypothetical protein
MTMKKTISAIVAVLSTVSFSAQSEFKTKSISIFKNGQAFVIKEGEISTKDNVYTFDKIPNALFGTLWFAGLKSNILQVTGKQEEVEESVERKAVSFRDLLYAYKNKRFTLTTNDEKIYTGTIEDFDLQNDANSPLIIKTDGKWISILPVSIKNIEFAEKPEKIIKTNKKEMKPVIKVMFEKGGNQQLSMMYLQNGISWIPTYLLELKSETEAQLKMQAEVINNVENIENADVNFVVGVPHFKFVSNPATLTSFAKQIYRRNDYDNYGGLGASFSNAKISQAAESSYSDNETISMPTIGTNIEADVSGDYYFYNVKNISLEKGERAHYSIFDIPIKIKHLYECDLSNMSEDQYNRYRRESNFTFDE